VISKSRTGDLSEINKHLRPLLAPYAALSKKAAIEKLGGERDEIQRMALIRLFSVFEAAFQRGFATKMKSAWDASDPTYAEQRREEDILKVLPNSIELCLQLFQSLQPRFSPADKGWLDRFRGWRNDVIHEGFVKEVEDDFEDTYARLRRIIALVEGA
jgi:hypothetical protein